MNEKIKEVVCEVAEVTGKTVVSFIPVGGVLATSVYDSVKSKVAEKRTREWNECIELRLSTLEKTVDEITDNELFITTILKATEIALKTAESEKRQYLANAVYNSIEASIEESKLTIFMDLLDRYSVWHIKMLKYWDNPKEMLGDKADSIYMDSGIGVLKLVFPEIVQNDILVNKIVKDLQRESLLTEGSYAQGTMTRTGLSASRTTGLGKEFLEFILGE